MSWNRTHAYPIVAKTLTAWLERPYEDVQRLCDEPVEQWFDHDGQQYILFVEAYALDAQQNAIRLDVAVGSSSTHRLERVEESRVRRRPRERQVEPPDQGRDE